MMDGSISDGRLLTKLDLSVDITSELGNGVFCWDVTCGADWGIGVML